MIGDSHEPRTATFRSTLLVRSLLTRSVSPRGHSLFFLLLLSDLCVVILFIFSVLLAWSSNLIVFASLVA